MKPKTLILMLVAVGCGLAAAYLASHVEGTTTADNRVGVVVALNDIPIGTMIKEPEKMVQVKAFLTDSAPVDGQRLSNVDDVRNKTIGRNIMKGEPILARDFGPQGLVLRSAPPGYRAVTIRVTLDSSVAGFALPGAKVDLTCTRDNPAKPGDKVVDTFMDNVLVLAVNTTQVNDSTQDTKTGVIPTPSVVTLAAKPVDAARIIWAKEKGSINLVLRRPGDDEGSKVPTITDIYEHGPDGGPNGKPRNQMVKVWVARENVFPQQIDHPEQLFKLEEVSPTVAEEAIRGPNPPPVGRLYSLVAKGMPVSRLHYQAADLTRPTPTDKPFIMAVVVGGKKPEYFQFTSDGHPLGDGQSVEGPGTAPPGAATEGAAENK